MANERVGYLHDAVLMLPERLRAVVTRYYFEERPMAEIAAELEVTESRVSQLRAEALTLLKGGLDATLGLGLLPARRARPVTRGAGRRRTTRPWPRTATTARA